MIFLIIGKQASCRPSRATGYSMYGFYSTIQYSPATDPSWPWPAGRPRRRSNSHNAFATDSVSPVAISLFLTILPPFRFCLENGPDSRTPSQYVV